MTHPATAQSTLSEDERGALDGCGVTFDEDGFSADGNWYSYDSIAASYLRQIARHGQTNPLSLLAVVAAMFLAYDLVVSNIDGVGFVIIVLAVIGVISYLAQSSSSVEVDQTSLVLGFDDGGCLPVLSTPDVNFAAFQVIEKELSRRLLAEARRADEVGA